MSVSTTLAKFGLTKAFNHLYKDPEANLLEAMDWADKFSNGGFANQRAAIRKAISDPSDPYYPYVRHILNDVDPEIVKTLIVNFFINGNLVGGPIQEELRQKYNCNIPWTILLDPTSACNLHCTGCWAAEYGNKLNLSYDEIDDIIKQGKEMGVYFYIYTGGEPLVRKDDLIRLCEKHDDCVFMAFTNGTLIDEAFTSENYDSITSEAYWDMMIEMGAYFVWYFHYMPVGNDASVELMPNPEQRELVYRRIREQRARKPLFAMDFQNDAEFVGGCIAGGKNYLHINANGDLDPCVFIHYSDSNIREKTILEALRSPLFMAYHDGHPFNDNMLRPCPMLENPELLREMVKKTGAKSTDLESPESVDVGRFFMRCYRHIYENGCESIDKTYGYGRGDIDKFIIMVE